MVGSHKVKKVASDAVAFLEVLDTAGVVADLSNQVIDQSSKAKDIGLVEYDKVISPESLAIRIIPSHKVIIAARPKATSNPIFAESVTA